jgi:hypothetical protein
MNNTLRSIQDWYLRQCNGEWEHAHGITIETLDNPGWTVRIDLSGTPWEKSIWPTLDRQRAPDEWVFCAKDGAQFFGRGDPGKLDFILAYFLEQVGRAKQ